MKWQLLDVIAAVRRPHTVQQGAGKSAASNERTAGARGSTGSGDDEPGRRGQFATGRTGGNALPLSGHDPLGNEASFGDHAAERAPTRSFDHDYLRRPQA